MRWQSVIAALGLGMIGGGAWVLWDQRHEQAEAAAVAPRPAPPASTGDIRLLLKHDGGALRLRWSPDAAGIRDASHGTLTITDGDHQSTLQLDGRELRAGLASYWPDGKPVAFRLETDAGASGQIDAPATTPPAPMPPRKPEVAKSAPRQRRHAYAGDSDRAAPIDDGLEWTVQPRPSPFGNGEPPPPAHRAPPRARVRPASAAKPTHSTANDSRWSRFKHRLPFWRK